MDYLSLKNTVKHHDHMYYNLSAPVLSDKEYDALYDELLRLEKARGYADNDSPTIRIGAFKGKVKHPRQLYSLKKVYSEDEIPPSMKVKTCKIDGANLSVTYDINRSLQCILTRGDGEFGESVAHLREAIKDVPNQALPYTYLGEVVTDNEVENYRNYVSGALGLDDVQEAKTRNLRFIVHDVLGSEQDYIHRLQEANSLGFRTVLTIEDGEYPQDGYVFRVETYKEERDLGYTSKAPRFALALKERGAASAPTTLLDIEWCVGRSGVVTPVGLVEPVVLDDAKISRVILHNLDFLLEHNLGPGDTILIERMITPQFLSQIEESSHPRFDQEHAERQLGCKLRKDGPRLFSEENNQRFLEYFTSTLGIKGLGPALLKKLNISEPLDLYTNADWSKLGSEKIADKIKEELKIPKPYSLVLASLGIPGVGKNTAKIIARHLPSFEQLKDIEFIQIEGIGPVTRNNILVWLETNSDWVTKLPYELHEHPEVRQDEPSRIFVVTGKLDMTKKALEEHLKRYNFVLKPTITKDTSVLITSGERSDKTEKAEKYGIPILNYWEQKTKILNGDF